MPMMDLSLGETRIQRSDDSEMEEEDKLSYSTGIRLAFSASQVPTWDDMDVK
jgi:hypothetical protein